jgi:hypothetical protein
MFLNSMHFVEQNSSVLLHTILSTFAPNHCVLLFHLLYQ